MNDRLGAELKQGDKVLEIWYGYSSGWRMRVCIIDSFTAKQVRLTNPEGENLGRAELRNLLIMNNDDRFEVGKIYY
jgi:hypothetical protein